MESKWSKSAQEMQSKAVVGVSASNQEELPGQDLLEKQGKSLTG